MSFCVSVWTVVKTVVGESNRYVELPPHRPVLTCVSGEMRYCVSEGMGFCDWAEVKLTAFVKERCRWGDYFEDAVALGEKRENLLELDGIRVVPGGWTEENLEELLGSCG